MKGKCLSLAVVMLGVALFLGGAGMRVYAQIVMAGTERQLLAARPNSPLSLLLGSNASPVAFPPADGAPRVIRVPDLGLWNTLAPVQDRITWQGGQIARAWEVSDGGWHVPSGWPGHGGNVVVAGHSPARDAAIWARSVFRQLPYLAPGNVIELTAGSRIYSYEVSRVFALAEGEADTPDAAAWIGPVGVERLTLVTCWPPHTAAYRVVVVARPLRVIDRLSTPGQVK